MANGESICANRVARLAQLAGIKAQIGYKRRPGGYGGKPSVVVDNTLDRQFDIEAPDRVWDETMSAIGPRTMVE
jgi:putative transposase